MLIDTHCHLDANRFDDDRPEVLRRARDAGVERMVTIGCDVAGSERALGLAKTHADVFCSAGVHPHEAEKAEDGFVDALKAIAAHPKCVAIGECGLDFYYDHSPRERQAEVFAAQIRLAVELQLPLVIHVRDAWDDCLRILREENAEKTGGIIHCFSGSLDQAKRSLDLNFYISIPGIVTFKKAGDLPLVVDECPRDRLLVETDSPYLAPKPYRGKRNEPAYVAHVAEKVAEIWGDDVENVKRVTGENARRVFRIS